MLEIAEAYGFVNDAITSTDWIRKNLYFKGRTVYEVIRLINSTPLFFEDHMKRLKQSCHIVGLEPDIEPGLVRKRIKKLVDRCDRQNGNLKIVFGETVSSGQYQLFIVFIPHFFPTPEMYDNGVSVTMLHMERPNPNAKLAKEKPRALQDLIDVESGFYEVLMVNSEDVITEGSRSNVFFIKNNVLYTSPVEDVLPGITREKVLQIIKRQGMELKFHLIRQDRIAEYEALFLTGTSPGVLPVRSINEVAFNPAHPLLRELMIHYQQLVKDSMAGIEGKT